MTVATDSVSEVGKRRRSSESHGLNGRTDARTENVPHLSDCLALGDARARVSTTKGIR